MVLVSGFNVYPNEVEEVIVKHPGVVEAAVIGLPDEHSGEAVVAYVVRRDPALTTDELRKFCRENMTGYKVPRRIEFRETLAEDQCRQGAAARAQGRGGRVHAALTVLDGPKAKKAGLEARLK